MAKVGLVWKLPEDRMSVTLEMHVDGEPKAHMYLDAAGLEEIVSELAGVRASMAEGVTPDLETGMRLAAVGDPRWRTEAYHPVGGAMLALRHPGHGWVSFLLPPAEARALGASLVAQAEELEAKGDPA
jgi:hypothetical protein